MGATLLEAALQLRGGVSRAAFGMPLGPRLESACELDELIVAPLGIIAAIPLVLLEVLAEDAKAPSGRIASWRILSPLLACAELLYLSFALLERHRGARRRHMPHALLQPPLTIGITIRTVMLLRPLSACSVLFGYLTALFFRPRDPWSTQADHVSTALIKPPTQIG